MLLANMLFYCMQVHGQIVFNIICYHYGIIPYW